MSTQMRRSWIMAGALTVLGAGAIFGETGFRAKTADKYPAKQRQGALIVAVKPFVSEKDQRLAFGKVRPYQWGVVPLLVVMSNTGRSSFSLEKLQIRMIMSDRESLDPVRGEDLASLNPKGHQPTRRSIPGVPGLSRTRVKKGPLDRPEITQNEFRAPILTPKSTASGFLYFFTGKNPTLAGASAYISGIFDLSTGRDVFYFEIPLGKR